MYSEEIRYDDLYMIHSGKWIFIRFNPDGANSIEDKIKILIDTIHAQIKRIEKDDNKELLEIIKLFYPKGKADVTHPMSKY